LSGEYATLLTPLEVMMMFLSLLPLSPNWRHKYMCLGDLDVHPHPTNRLKNAGAGYFRPS
jgi:hypothetical protein